MQSWYESQAGQIMGSDFLSVWPGCSSIQNWIFNIQHSSTSPILLYQEAGWQKLCEGTKGLRRKVWTRTKMLSPNKRYFVAILRFVAIYAFYIKLLLSFKCKTASFCPDSDKRVKRKIASFRPDLDERQLPFVQAQTKDNFFSSRLRRKTASFRQDLDVR